MMGDTEEGTMDGDSTVNGARADHERKIRDVVESQMAVHDQLLAALDDVARLRSDLAMQRQRADHYQHDLTVCRAERDHYMTQVASFIAQFEAATGWFARQAEQMRAWSEAAVRAPYARGNGPAQRVER